MQNPMIQQEIVDFVFSDFLPLLPPVGGGRSRAAQKINWLASYAIVAVGLYDIHYIKKYITF